MENKKRLIYAEDAKQAVGHADPAFMDYINNVPTADVVEMKHGHWIIDKSFMPFISTCSECGVVYDIDGAFDWKFCPICGARMDGAINYEF